MGADVEHQSAAAGARVRPVEGWRRRQGLREEAELVSFTRLAKPAELAIQSCRCISNILSLCG